MMKQKNKTSFPYENLVVIGIALLLIACLLWMGRAPATRDNGKTTITYWNGWIGDELTLIEGFVDQFNRSQPDIQARTISIANSYQKMKIAFAGNDTPDLCSTVWTHELADYAARGCLEPLDDYIAHSNRRSTDYYDSVWQTYQYEGKTYALSQSMITFFIGYNKKLFRQAGIDPEYHPKTIEEFDALAKRLTIYRDDNPRNEILCLGYPYGNPYGEFLNWAMAFGAQIWDEKTRTIHIDSPQMIACLTWLKANADAYGLARLRAYQSSFGNVASPNNPFISGKVAMIMVGDWYRSIIEEYAPDDFEWGWFPLPEPPNGRIDSTFLTSSMFVIPRASKHKDAAWRLMEWLTSNQVCENMHVGSSPSGRPALRAAGESAPYQTPYWDFVGSLLASKNAIAPPKIPLFDRFSSDLTRVVDFVMSGEKTPEQAVREMQMEFQDELDGVFHAIEKREGS